MKKKVISLVLILVMLLASTSIAFGATVKIGKTYNLSVMYSTISSVYLEWQTVKNITGYCIYRSTDEDSGYKKIATTKGTEVNDSWRSYNDLSVKSGNTYYYKVRAYKKVNGKTYYGKYSRVVMAETKYDQPVFYSGAAPASTSNMMLYVGLSSGLYYNTKIDMDSMYLYDMEKDRIIRHLKPSQVNYNDSTWQSTWETMQGSYLSLKNGNNLGIILTQEDGRTYLSGEKYGVMFDVEYNDKHYCVITSINKTIYTEIRWYASRTA